MKKLLTRLLVARLLLVARTRRDDGASAVEYGLLVALIAVVIAATVGLLGGALDTQFDSVCDTVAGGAGCP